MTAALIITLLAAVVALVAARREQAWATPVLVVTTVVALILGSWSVVSRVTRKTSAETALDAQSEAGRVLAEQVAAQVGSGQLLVLTYAPVAGERWFTDLRVEGFTNALAGKGFQVILAGPNVSPQGVPDASFQVWPRETLSSEAAAWIAKNKDVKAIISLMPFPPRDFSSRGLPLYAFAVHEMPEWQAGVRAGTTKAVLVSRPTVMGAEAARPGLAWNEMFELVTPENIAAYRRPGTT
jgi:ABC-type sugar transport system substrate-binding protein